MVKASERLVQFRDRAAVVSGQQLRALLAVLGQPGRNSSAKLERVAGLPTNQCPGSNWRGQWTKLRYTLGREGINVDQLVQVVPRGRMVKGGYESLVQLRVVE